MRKRAKRSIAKLEALPEKRQTEVEDFVDFLTAKERVGALNSFLAVANQIAKAGAPALSPEELEAEIKGLRSKRRRPNAAGA